MGFHVRLHRAGLDAVLEGIESEQVPYTIHQVPDTDASFVLADAYKAADFRPCHADL